METSGKILRILYAEDNEGLRHTIADLLRTRGHVVVAVEDGQELLDSYVAGSGAFDCVVSDFRMPRVDGLTALQQMRARGVTTPFIIHTGGGGGSIKEAVELEGGLYVSKTAPLRVLVAVIEKATGADDSPI